MDNSTTIEVPRTFLEKLHKYDGHNNYERLKHWASEYQKETEYITKDQLEETVERKIEEAKYQNY